MCEESYFDKDSRYYRVNAIMIILSSPILGHSIIVSQGLTPKQNVLFNQLLTTRDTHPIFRSYVYGMTDVIHGGRLT